MTGGAALRVCPGFQKELRFGISKKLRSGVSEKGHILGYHQS
jgi:hypothetical protein